MVRLREAIGNLHMRLANGVDITIRSDGEHRLLLFDQNVKVLDLEPKEATQIGASLYRAKSSVVYPVVVGLVETGFFDTPRTFREVANAARKENPSLKGNSVVMVLRILCAKGLLSRTGKRRNYVYKKTK
jgi:hypothetical protein